MLGALAGALYAWLTRNRLPEAKTLADGMQVMQPVYVSPTPWQTYAGCAVLGMVVTLLAVMMLDRLRRIYVTP